MEPLAMMDKLAELLVCEHGAYRLYGVAADHADSAQQFQQAAEGCQQRQTRLVALIERLGGDPSRVAPLARLAQYKGDALLQTALVVDGMTKQQLQANDLENLLVTETKIMTGWRLLLGLIEQDHSATGEAVRPLANEIASIAEQQIGVLMGQMADVARAMAQGEGVSPAGWQRHLTAPEPPLSDSHPAVMPVASGLLDGAREPMWQEAPLVRMSRQARS